MEPVLTMHMRCLWLCGVAIVLGCGARSLSGDGTGSGASDNTTSDDEQVPSDTGATSSGITSTPTSSSPDTPTSSAGETSSSGSTTSLDTSPIPGTWEGVTHNTEWGTYITLCDFGEVCFPESCGNLYVHAVGTLRWVQQGIDGCNGWYLDIEEVLAARACEPTDCEADCDGPVWCDAECDAFAQDCPWGEKCAAVATNDVLDTHPRRCKPLPPAPVAEGEACTVAAATDEGYDDCDAGLHCWAEEPAATTGMCVPFCSPDFPDSCPEDCVGCSFSSFGEEGLCLSDCPACNLSHSC